MIVIWHWLFISLLVIYLFICVLSVCLIHAMCMSTLIIIHLYIPVDKNQFIIVAYINPDHLILSPIVRP